MCLSDSRVLLLPSNNDAGYFRTFTGPSMRGGVIHFDAHKALRAINQERLNVFFR